MRRSLCLGWTPFALRGSRCAQVVDRKGRGRSSSWRRFSIGYGANPMDARGSCFAIRHHNDDADVVLPRLRELRTKHDELTAILDKIVPMRPIPAHLYSEATIRKFLEHLREMLLAPDSTMTRNYLRFLVDEITVNGPEITIHARGEAVVGLMAAGGEKPAPLNPGEPVLTTVGGWRARRDSIGRARHDSIGPIRCGQRR